MKSPPTYRLSDVEPAAVADRQNASVTVLIPVLNEAATLGPILDAVGRSAVTLEQVIVVDDHSTDASADVARAHGARVVENHADPGKGQALRTGLAASTGEIVVFLDGDVTSPLDDPIARMTWPLFANGATQLVKPFYDRPYRDVPHEGGRVTQLAARPILSLLYPGLEQVFQPLAGETAIRRGVLDEISLADGYRIEMALLIDVARRYGIEAVAQVDLGVRAHRNRPLHELHQMSVEVIRTALERHEG